MDRVEKLASGISSFSKRERAEREIEHLTENWVCLSELAKRARLRTGQMCKFLTEHLSGKEFVVEPFVERRCKLVKLGGVRLSVSEYRRRVELVQEVGT